MEVQRDQRRRRVAAVDALNRMAQAAVARRHKRQAVVVDEAESNIRAREGEANDKIADPACLSCVCLEKFLARGRVEEEVLHTYSGSDLAAGILDLGCLAAENVHTRTEIVRRLPREEGKARDGCDRRQGLTAKAERCDRLQIGNRGDLACRMAQDRRLGIRARHAVTIVGHTDEARASAHNLHLDGRRTCVDRILNELLDYGGGTLDDLARRDLIDSCIVQHMNPRHASPASFRACSCRR